MNDLFEHADKMAEQYNLDPALFRAVVSQESKWKTDAVSPVGAQGLGQVMPATGASPGWGIKPLQDNSPQENLRFSAEYLSKMIQLTGKVDLGLAAYNAGYGAVLKHKGIPPYKETQDYVTKILGNVGTELSMIEPTAPVSKEGLPKYEAGLVDYNRIMNDPRIGQGAKEFAKADPNAITDAVVARAVERERVRAANVATGAEAREDAIANETLTAAHMRLLDAGPVTDWQPTAEHKTAELSMGLTNYPQINSYVQGFRNEEDYHQRLSVARMRMEHAQRVNNATGWDAAGLAMNSMIGAMADPEAALLSFGLGTALNGVRAMRAGLAASRAARVGANAVEGFLGNSLVQAGLEGALNSEVSWSNVLQQGVFGASFGAGLSLPVQARRAGVEAGGMASFDRLTQELGEAIDANAAPSHVAALQRSIDDVRDRMLSLAQAEGDEIAARVWANAGPGARSVDIHDTIKAMRRAADEKYSTLDPVHEASPADIVPPRTAAQMAEGKGTVELAGMRLSAEATSIRQFAYDLWDDTVDPALADMQKRMQDFYKMREAKLGDYAGLAKWLDSPSLIAQRSSSKVARMLGAHLFESATGLGKRTQSAALNYEIMHSRLAHHHIPSLKEALLDGLKGSGSYATVRHALGGARAEEGAFWRAVMAERIAHRNAIANKQEFLSTASEPVQRAATILDRFWRESADLMEKAGLEEGKAIKTLGVVGHVPYRWDALKLSDSLRNNPAVFDAFQSMIEEEFRAKVLDGMMDKLAEGGNTKMQARRTALEGDIAAIQDEIAKMEDARRVIDDTRNDVKAVADELSKLNAIRKELLASEKQLKQELKELEEQGPEVQGDAAVRSDQRFRFTRQDNQETDYNVLRSSPDVTEITASEMVRRIRNAPGFPKEKRELVALADALEADIALGDDFPILLSSKNRGDHGSFYNAAQHFILLDRMGTGLTTERAFVALHELAHARTSRWLYQVTDKLLIPSGFDFRAKWQPGKQVDLEAAAKVGIPVEVAQAWNKLENIRDMLLQKRPELVGKTSGLGYAMKDSHELLAQVFNDPSVRASLDAIQLPGERSVLRAIWEAVAAIFSMNKDKTALSEVVEAFDLISQQHGRWVEARRGVDFAPQRSKTDVAAALEAVQKQKAEIDARRKEMQSSKKQAKEATQKIADTSGVKQLDNLRLQLNNRKALLADMQRDPLGWWAGQVNQLRNAAETKAKALTSSYLKQVIQDPNSRVKGATLHATRLAEDLLRENWEGLKVDADLAKEFGELLRDRLSDKSRTEFDLSRTRTVNGQEVSLMDFMDVDGLAQVKTGSHRVAGAVSLAKMGMKDEVSISAAMEAARTDGASPDELKALQFGFDFLSDNLGVSDHGAMHALRNMTYFTRMGKLGISMVADVPQMVSTLGLGLALKTWGQSWLQHSFNGRDAYGRMGKATPFAKQLAQVAPGALGRDHRLMTLVADNPASGAADQRGAAMLQRVSARGAQFVSWISGANNVSMAMHRALLPVIAEEILGAVKGKSAINDVRLRDMGMSEDLLNRIKGQMDKFDAGRKQGDAVNWDQWEDQLAADEFIGVIHRAMYQTLQKSMLGESPQWLVDSSMGRLIGQFRRFGLTAAEKITARNAVGYNDSQALLGAVMGLAWASVLYYARIHVNAAGKEDAEAYIEKQLEPLALTRGVMTMWNMSGLGADVMNIGEVLFGGNQRADVSPAAALGTVTDIAKAAGAVGGLVTGEEEAGKAAAQVMRLLPGANSVPLTYLLNELQKD